MRVLGARFVRHFVIVCIMCIDQWPERHQRTATPRRDAPLRAAGRDVAAMSRPRRDAVRGARALAPAVEDAPVRTRDDARSSDSSEDEARARRRDKHLTTQKFVESIANAKGALLAEDVERLYAARCEEVAHDGRDQSDTESDASEEERGKWWPLTAVTTPKSAAEACAAEAKRAEEEGIVPEGTMATSELMIHNWLHLSESLTRWRRAGTMVLTPPPDELRCHTCRDFAAGAVGERAGAVVLRALWTRK